MMYEGRRREYITGTLGAGIVAVERLRIIAGHRAGVNSLFIVSQCIE
jgi:hypothetical protein